MSLQQHLGTLLEKTCPLKSWAFIEKNMSENGKNMYMESELRELQQWTAELKQRRPKVHHLCLPVMLACWRYLKTSPEQIWRGANAFLSSFILKTSRSFLLLLTSVLGGGRMKNPLKGIAKLSLPQSKSSSVCPPRKDPPHHLKITSIKMHLKHLHCCIHPSQGVRSHRQYWLA